MCHTLSILYVTESKSEMITGLIFSTKTQGKYIIEKTLNEKTLGIGR